MTIRQTYAERNANIYAWFKAGMIQKEQIAPNEACELHVVETDEVEA